MSILKNIFFRNNVISKNILLAGDFNINLLYFEHIEKFQNFVKLMFQFELAPTTSKPTRITKTTISAIDRLITNFIINKRLILQP